MQVQEWWQQEGSSQTFAPAGGDAQVRGGTGTRSKWMSLEAVPETAAAESEPPVFASLSCVLTKEPAEQALYYEANPATNKKVRPCKRRVSMPPFVRPAAHGARVAEQLPIRFRGSVLCKGNHWWFTPLLLDIPG